MPAVSYKLRGKLWLHAGAAGWHFITLPQRPARELRDLLGDQAGGWGSLRVSVTLGATTWQTSIFPDKKSGSYLLPIKAAVRKAEGLEAGSMINYQLTATA